MDIPDGVVKMILDFTDEHREYTHIAMFSDGIGGFSWYYCEDKRIAEKYTAGMKNTEVIEITD